MVLPLSGIGHFVDFLVLIFFYYRIRKNRIANNKFFYYFEKFTLSMSLFFLLMALPNLLVPENSFMLGLGFVIGHIFLYISYAYLARIALLILKPTLNSVYVFRFFLFLAVAITVVNSILFNSPVVLESGITAFNVSPVIGITITLLSIITLLPSAVMFIVQAFQQPQQRTRYALIGISFILIIAGGPLHDVATTPTVYLIADAITTLAFILMFFGVISGTKPTLATNKSEV